MAAALLLVACGGSNAPNIPGLPGVPVVYTNTDGHIEGAWAYCMVNPNVSYSQAPNFKAVAASNVNGKFQFPQPCNAEVMAFGGESYALDGKSKTPFKGLLKAPAGATMVTPITTLMTGPNALTKAQVQTALGLTDGVDFLTADPAELKDGVAKFAPLLQKTLLLQQLVFDTAASLAKLGGVDITVGANTQNVAAFQDIYQTTAASLIKTLATATSPLVSGSTVNQSLVEILVKDAAIAVSRVNSNVEVAVTQTTSAQNIASATFETVARQAAQYLTLDPATQFAEFGNLTSQLQNNTGIGDALAANVASGKLSASKTSAEIKAVADQIGTSVTTITTTTISSTTTTTAPISLGNLYLVGDSVDYSDGVATQTYPLAAFGASPGVSVNWPVPEAAALSFKLGQSSNFVAPSGYVTAALKITDASSASGASVKAYVNQVKISKEAGGIKVTVASDANAWIYAKSANGDELVKGFADQVSNLSSVVMGSATATSVPVGAFIRDAISRLGQVDYLPVTKYRVTLVLNGVAVKQENGTALTSYTVDVPVSGGGIKTVTGSGIEGYLTVVNTNSAPVTTTSSTTTTLASTTTTTVSPNNYLYIADNTVSYDTGSGAAAVAYSMDQFQAKPGIAVPWPMLDASAISFKLANGGAFNVGSGKTVRAALELADADPAGSALIKAYVDNVRITQSGTDVTVTVPSSAFAKVYARDASGTEFLSSFGDTVAGVNSTFSTSSAVTNRIEVGSVVNNAVARVGSVTGLVGKTYRVTLVLDGLSLRQSSGAALGLSTVVVPGGITSGGTPVTITGSGLSGYITLGDKVSAPSTTTTSTSTTASTTTTTQAPSPNNYVYLANDALAYIETATATPVPYSVGAFQTSPGMAVKWPMDNAAAIRFSLTDAGAFNIGSGLSTRAAFEIKDTASLTGAQIVAYIDNVLITKSGSVVTVSVPSSAFAKVYARDAAGTEVLTSFGDAVAGTSATLSTATGVSNSLVIGNVVNNALARMGTVSGLTDKTYQMRLVVENLPLRLSSGTTLPTGSITLQTVTITGPSLVGYIRLTP
jgi:hypothetical protein